MTRCRVRPSSQRFSTIWRYERGPEVLVRKNMVPSELGDTMIIRQISGFSKTVRCWRGTRIGALVRSPAHHQKSYVENRAATVKKKSWPRDWALIRPILTTDDPPRIVRWVPLMGESPRRE